MDAASHNANETLGQTLIPVINKLQDLFSQVCSMVVAMPESCFIFVAILHLPNTVETN